MSEGISYRYGYGTKKAKSFPLTQADIHTLMAQCNVGLAINQSVVQRYYNMEVGEKELKASKFMIARLKTIKKRLKNILGQLIDGKL